MGKLAIWLTPLWILAVGVAIGAALLLLMWGVCWVVNRRAARAISAAVGEGILRPISYVAASLAALAVLAAPSMPVEKLTTSLQRLPSVQPIVIDVEVPARETDFAVPASFLASELQRYMIKSDQDVAINTDKGKGFVEPLLIVEGSERDALEWTPSTSQFATSDRAFEGPVTTLYITNESDAATNVALRFYTDVEMPQVRAVPIAAVSTVGLYLLYLAIRFLAPRTSVIAAATAKETIAQPLYTMLIGIGVVMLVAFVFIPYNTFGEDVKMLKTSGMTLIKVLAIIMALWTASTSVADEIEGRTALTVLSKPVSRRQFILGKFLGIIWPIVLMFVILGFVFLLTVSFKVVYDARESAKTTPEWTECYLEVVRIIPGLVLAFFESVIMAAISVAVSTRLPMLPNLVICGSIYVLGHLAALIVKTSAADNIVFVRFVGRLLAMVLPVLDHFEIEGAIAGATSVPMAYLGWALVYTAVYSAAAILLALYFFEDRDLA
ncbi:MAG: ABC transporter permease subunit [Pirellulales bacterium]|nr:ABC transporter permease subunit [Pirellulales bacterium]